MKSPFVRRIVMLASSIAAGQAITYAASPIITRIYSPADYGAVAAFFAVLTVMSFLGTFNYELAIPIARSESDALAVAIVSLALLVASAVALAVVLVICPHSWLSGLAGVSAPPAVFWFLMPVALVLIGCYGTFAQWAYRAQDFGRLSRTRISQGVAQVTASLGLGLLAPTALSLLVGRVAGQSAGAGSLGRPVWSACRRGGWPPIGHLRAVARRYVRFPIFTTPRRYFGDLVLTVPILFLGNAYGAQSVGYFALATSTIQMPLNVLGDAVGSVYVAESARGRFADVQRLLKLGDRLVWALGAIAVVATAVLVLIGPWLFATVFGTDWEDAGVYAVYLAPAMMARFVFKPVSNVFDIFERQVMFLVISVVKLGLVLVALVAAVRWNTSVETTLGVYSAAVLIGFLIQHFLARRVLRLSA